MAEVKDGPLPARTILYTEKQLANFEGRFSRLKPIEPGDRCCNCGLDCDGEGFSISGFTAVRVYGHPLCARTACYWVVWDEFNGKRAGCSCGKRSN
jgi:hypothetical protein